MTPSRRKVECGKVFDCLLIRGLVLIAFFARAIFAIFLHGQTASTGAVAGRVLDASGALVRGAEIRLINQGSGDTSSSSTDNEGSFHFVLLPQGTYDLRVSKTGFARLLVSNLNILVTETSHLDLHLDVGVITQTIEVSSEASAIQPNTIALGRVVNQSSVTGLPLVTRNFAQIASLSPGVATGVSNAGELGAGGTAMSQIDKSNDGLFVHGARSYDNNFELDGVSVREPPGSIRCFASSSASSQVLRVQPLTSRPCREPRPFAVTS
jgi:hypothetical protein